MGLAMNIIEDVRQQISHVNLHEHNLVALPLITLFVEACHIIFLCKLDKNNMPHTRMSSFELLVLQYTLDNTHDNSEDGIQLDIGISANGFQQPKNSIFLVRIFRSSAS